MIIIKIDVDKTDACIMAIATVMFNMELGKNVYSLTGEFNDDAEDYHVLYKDGISYTIQGTTGRIVVLYNGDDRRYNEFLGWDLEKLMVKLDNEYINKYGVIEQYDSRSMDYTLASTFTSKNDDNCRRIIVHKDINKKKGLITWMFQQDKRSTLFPEFMREYNRNTWEFSRLKDYNTIIIDTDNIYNTENTVTMLQQLPEPSMYTMIDRFIDMKPITISEKYDGIQQQIYDAFGVVNQKTFYSSVDSAHIFTPIYEEKWENIKPARCSILHEKDIDFKINTILNTLKGGYDYTMMELEEIKNVESGVPPTFNDICHCCYMYLYDTIYVLEEKNCHICVCSRCFHSIIYPSYMDNKSQFYDATVLKVRYPRSIIDILNHEKNTMSDEKKQLMTELINGDYKINNGEVITPTFAGCLSISAVLLKQTIPTAGKKLFVWEE